VGGSSDIRVLGEVDIKLFTEESKPLQKLHCGGCLEIVTHLHKSMVRLVVEDLNANDISVIGKKIKKYVAVHFLLVQIGNEKHAIELGADETHREGQAVLLGVEVRRHESWLFDSGEGFGEISSLVSVGSHG